MKAVKQKNIDFIDTNEHKRSKEDFSKVSKNSKNPVGAYMNWQFNKSICENKDNRKYDYHQSQLKETVSRQMAIQSIIDNVEPNSRSNIVSTNLSPILSNRTSPLNFRMLLQKDTEKSILKQYDQGYNTRYIPASRNRFRLFRYQS